MTGKSDVSVDPYLQGSTAAYMVCTSAAVPCEFIGFLLVLVKKKPKPLSKLEATCMSRKISEPGTGSVQHANPLGFCRSYCQRV